MLREFPNELVQSMAWDTGDETEAAEAILEESVLEDEKRHDLSKTLARSMRQIKGYQKLIQEVCFGFLIFLWGFADYFL